MEDEPCGSDLGASSTTSCCMCKGYIPQRSPTVKCRKCSAAAHRTCCQKPQQQQQQQQKEFQCRDCSNFQITKREMTSFQHCNKPPPQQKRSSIASTNTDRSSISSQDQCIQFSGAKQPSVQDKLKALEKCVNQLESVNQFQRGRIACLEDTIDAMRQKLGEQAEVKSCAGSSVKSGDAASQTQSHTQSQAQSQTQSEPRKEARPPPEQKKKKKFLCF